MKKFTPKVKEAILNQYRNSEDINLFQVYQNPSSAKVAAYNHFRDMFYEENGHRFRIISHNMQMFTLGWTFRENGKYYFRYITKDYVAKFPIDESEVV